MTDRELLELAAKAAGATLTVYERTCNGKVIETRYSYAIPEAIDTDWNPLNDDGDALRLAVKLKLTVQQNEMSVYVFTHNGTTPYAETNEVHRNEIDTYAATRRAIVRAAAEIGRNKND